MRSYDSPNIAISLWFAQFVTQYNDSTADAVSSHITFILESSLARLSDHIYGFIFRKWRKLPNMQNYLKTL